ncbi:hypothetical protein [Oceanobacter sp. 4_MG-2023]|uniref:hypothetical protein n=1 Tax=Oceanobacter sp. 4_MG-2023 TaxID=3062623 RepID=UPI002735EF06|nr:hypothetical protein [Oceanobacter sp. 4_MG-2023]MDP2549076.1 hypothetical protein [Oceanobacter sp. 4_MG-2023]
MKEIIAAVVALLIGAGGAYFFQNGKINKLEERIDALITGQVPAYGILSRVNRVELEKSSSPFTCKLQDGGFPKSKGIIRYFWDFEYAYGIIVPPNYDWKVDELGNGVGEVVAPSLQQLRPAKVEFKDFDEINEADGDRWERMYYDALIVAKEWVEYTGEFRLKADENLWNDSKSSLTNMLLPLVNQARESANKPKFNTLKVVFNGQPDSFEAKALLLPKECKPIPGA